MFPVDQLQFSGRELPAGYGIEGDFEGAAHGLHPFTKNANEWGNLFGRATPAA